MKFPEKLWKIVNECISGAVGWGMDGDRIFIDYDKFEMEYLGKDSGFKTKNVVSFIRQLNLYGFRKCSRYTDVHEFKHPSFLRGRPDLVKLVKRKLGYRASINTEKMDVKMESPDTKVLHNSENTFPPVAAESSAYNILLHQMQQYCLHYSEWIRKNGPLLQKESQHANEAANSSNSSGSAEDSAAGQCSCVDPTKTMMKESNSNNKVVYVPVPVPAHYGWPVRMFGPSVTVPSPSSSDEASDEIDSSAIVVD